MNKEGRNNTKKAPVLIFSVESQPFLSVARYYGGCTSWGMEYVYIPIHDALIRKDYMKVYNKMSKKGMSWDDFVKYVETKDREEYMILESWIKYILHKRKIEMMYKKYFSENVIPQIRNEFIKKDLLKHYGAKIFESIANSDTFNYLQIMTSSS